MLQDLRAGEGGIFADPENVSAPILERQWNAAAFLNPVTDSIRGLGHPNPMHHFRFTRRGDGRATAEYRNTDDDDWVDTGPLLTTRMEEFPQPDLDPPVMVDNVARVRKLVEQMPEDLLWRSSWDDRRDAPSWAHMLDVLDDPLKNATCNLQWPSTTSPSTSSTTQLETTELSTDEIASVLRRYTHTCDTRTDTHNAQQTQS